MTDSDSISGTTSDIENQEYDDYYDDYYDAIVSWQNGEDLHEQLSALINTNVMLVDFGSSSQKWTVNQVADEAFDNLDRVSLAYAEYQPLKTYTNTSSNKGWQREHAFAQTLGNFDVSNSRPESEDDLVISMRSDFHNLFAADGSLNNSRGNKNLGNVSSAMGEIYLPTDSYGDETGCRAIKQTETNPSPVAIFEPRSQDKPMMARAIFYMATRFDDLNVVEGIAVSRSKTHGMRSDLLSWSRENVSRREYKHNVGVYQYQHNRNPYVDFPELVDYVFGDKRDEAGYLVNIRPSYYDVVLSGGEADAKAVHNLAIKDIAVTYQAGYSYDTSADLKVLTVNRDLSLNAVLATSQFTTSLADGYVFLLSDVGTRQIDVAYSGMSVTYEIKIEADPSLLATYQYTLTKDDAFKSKTSGSVHEISLSDIVFNLYLESGSASDFETASGRGRKFGTASAPIKSMYIETKSAFLKSEKVDVNAVYIVASTASASGNPKLDVTIGEHSFPQQAMIVGSSGDNTLYSFALPEGETYQGKVRIAFSGFTGGALYLNRFAINAL